MCYTSKYLLIILDENTMLLVEIPLSPKLYKPIIQVMYHEDHNIVVYNKLSHLTFVTKILTLKEFSAQKITT